MMDENISESNHNFTTNISIGWLTTLQVTVPILAAAGIIANCITIFAVCLPHMRKNVNNIMIGNLAVAELLYSCSVLLAQSVIYHLQPGDSDDWVKALCAVIAPFRFTLSGVILVLLSVIALYRYLNIVHTDKFRSASSTIGVTIALGICWTLPLFICLPSAFRVWGSYDYEPQTMACYFSRNVEGSNRIVTVTAGFLVPVIFILFCYSRIGILFLKNRKRMKPFRRSVRSTSMLGANKDSVRLAGMMACLFFVFVFVTIPYMVVNLLDKEMKQPHHHIWTTLLAWCMYCMNPLIYTVMSKNFQVAYKDILTCRINNHVERRKRSSMCDRRTLNELRLSSNSII